MLGSSKDASGSTSSTCHIRGAAARHSACQFNIDTARLNSSRSRRCCLSCAQDIVVRGVDASRSLISTGGLVTPGASWHGVAHPPCQLCQRCRGLSEPGAVGPGGVRWSAAAAGAEQKGEARGHLHTRHANIGLVLSGLLFAGRSQASTKANSKGVEGIMERQLLLLIHTHTCQGSTPCQDAGTSGRPASQSSKRTPCPRPASTTKRGCLYVCGYHPGHELAFGRAVCPPPL